jgi:hypothetical protein
VSNNFPTIYKKMKTLRQIIKEELLVEKRIAQVTSSLEVIFSFDVNRTTHAFDRDVRDDIVGYNPRPIVNAEIKEIIATTIKEISEKIVTREIVPEEDFVVKSLKWELAIAITPVHMGGTHWQLILKTVFRESKYNPFRVGKDQLVIYSDFG